MNNKLKTTRLVVNKGSSTKFLDTTPETLVVPFEELVHLAKRGALFRLVLRFKKVLLRVKKIESITSPFLTICLVKILSRRYTVIEDDVGECKAATWLFIYKKFLDYVREWADNQAFLSSVVKEVDRHTSGTPPQKNTLKVLPSGQPVYLRTDLTSGLLAGGSVGHVAGVLNNLADFSKPPIFISSEQIPCVDPSIEAHFILPDNRFLSFPESRCLYYSRTVTRKSKQILRSKRISFIYQRYSLNNFAGYKLSKYYNVPFVLEYNGSEIWVGKNWGKHVKNETLSNVIEELNLRYADLVVVVSKTLKNEIEERGVNPQKILVNPNGVDTERYHPEIDSSQVRNKWDLESKTVIGFIGTFGRWHGAEVLVDAFGMLLSKNPEYRDTVRLLLIGDGLMMPFVKEKATDLNLINNIIFTGIVPQHLGPAHMAACDILVSPHVPNPDGTAFFGSPTKIFEYMAMGKGIVASNLGQIGEVLKHNETAWMVQPADVHQLMEGLKILIERSDLRNHLGKEARSKAIQKYTWKMHTHRIFEALAGLNECN